ncbi:hypothetical protein [Allopontixanthobacter sediminis]|uniref:Uncharacterized protein n=1 Tax=Allopontixanthobacter sediminis TaxID=1689985 RepID=A0A845AYY6_9SPHN|nr:hypothetical protein [Allopontixanthobacter sediminis]MXP44231.1 hypothetical protein [Allopontixanthobacter sediminis]
MKPINQFAALAALTMLAAPAAAQEDAGTLTKGEVELAKLLEGRVAGEPQSCVRSLPSENINVIDGTALVVGRGKTIYVNVPQYPSSLDDDDVLLVRRFSGSQLCRLDQIETRDRFGGFYSGNVMLNDFVPYTRVEKRSDEG